MIPADPQRVVAAARLWLGTPYHDQASLMCVGCDCLGLARGVWRDVVGPEPFPIPLYSRDWGKTGPREVLAGGARAMMIEVVPADAGPGALVRFRMKPRAIATHVGSLTGPGGFIHAYERLGVIEEPLTNAWRRRIPKRETAFAIETPPARGALAESRTIKGGGVAGVATIGAAGVEIARDVLAPTQAAVQPLVPYLDGLRWVFIGAALAGTAVTIYARLDDWRRGRR